MSHDRSLKKSATCSQGSLLERQVQSLQSLQALSLQALAQFLPGKSELGLYSVIRAPCVQRR